MLATVKENVDKTLHDTGGNPALLQTGTVYYVHAIAMDTSGEVSVCLRDPQIHPVFPYFYSMDYLALLDARVPGVFELAIHKHTDLHRVVIAPPFWARDPMFYEQLANERIDATDGVAGEFLRHVAQVQQSQPSDVVV